MHSIFVIGDSISIQYGPYLSAYLDGFMHYDRLAGDPGNLDDPEGANAGDSRRVLHLLDQLGDIDADWLLLNCAPIPTPVPDRCRWTNTGAIYAPSSTGWTACARVWCGCAPRR